MRGPWSEKEKHKEREGERERKTERETNSIKIMFNPLDKIIGPHSRTFSEVSSEMFLTGFGKTT